MKIGRHLPIALTLVAIAQHEHRDGFEDEAPDDSECVGFTEGVDVAPAHDDGEELQSYDDVDDAIGSAVTFVRPPEPVGKHAVFRDSIQNAVGTHNGSVYGAGKDEESDDNNKCAESQPQNLRPDHVHGKTSDQVVAVHLHANVIRDQHDRQQRHQAGENEAVNADDNGRALQVFELGMREFTINLRQRFLAAHGQYGMPEAYDESENAEHVGQLAVLPEAERFVGVVDVGEGRKRRQVAANL